MKSVLVVGTGTMGRGIAQVTASAGLETRVCDVNLGVAERAVASIAEALDRWDIACARVATPMTAS